MNVIGVDYGDGNDIAMISVMKNVNNQLELVESVKVEDFDYSKYLASDHQIVGEKSDLEKFKSYLELVYHNIKVIKEPEESLRNLLSYEEKYGINTDDALKFYDLLGEEVHFNDRYNYLLDWINEYENYKFFGGDASKINSLSIERND